MLTDIATAWTECAPIVVREATLIVEAIQRLRPCLPFPLLGIDTDNGSEFLNETSLAYCENEKVEMTRSRPYRKNDQAWVEQKNGFVVRRLVGYRRLEGIAAADQLSRLYTAARLFVNFFQPSFKLKEKIRVGARFIKKYHLPKTPCARALESAAVEKVVKEKLQSVATQLDPLHLLDEIRDAQSAIVRIAEGGAPCTSRRGDSDLAAFLAGLSSAWRAGEVRPTHRKVPKVLDIGARAKILSRKYGQRYWVGSKRNLIGQPRSCFGDYRLSIPACSQTVSFERSNAEPSSGGQRPHESSFSPDTPSTDLVSLKWIRIHRRPPGNILLSPHGNIGN